VTFINPVAAKLCGWDAAEATGRPCEEVFHIISEETRQVVENPVEKVVRTGATGRLADHTLLVRRDGTEIPIDDSGAPIRDEHGVLHGVVLIFRDFTEHKKTEAALQQARAAAEAASRAKDNFLATLSHELRTPLTPVMMTLSAWEADDTLKAGTADEVRMMRRNLDLEARLIDDLLDLTRIIRGKMHIKLERADVNALVAAAEQMYENDFRSKRVSVDVRLAARESFALIDPARFQQVLWNVLKNAMKFTPAGGKIRVLTEQNDGRLRVTVTDTGIGMSPELLARLFRPFEQSDELRVRRQGGLGLGLAIAKALIERQNGTITAHSAGVEKGSTFVIEVPSAGGAPVDTGAPAQTPDRPAAGTRLLLVEDHADTALALSRLLRKNDYEVLIAGSVAEAADVSDRETVDLLLSDVGLPDGTGVDVVKRFREKSAAPAIALTGYGMEDDVQMCLKAGFTLHMTKPVNFTKLLETIRTLISLRA
jgi:PAS domain S-box-containing protein